MEGAPELIAEVAASGASIDLGDKLRAYRRNGVREYIVWRVYFDLRCGFQECRCGEISSMTA